MSDRSVPTNEVMRNVNALNQDMKAAGAWVFAAGLHPPHTATVLRAGDGRDKEAAAAYGAAIERVENAARANADFMWTLLDHAYPSTFEPAAGR